MWVELGTSSAPIDHVAALNAAVLLNHLSVVWPQIKLFAKPRMFSLKLAVVKHQTPNHLLLFASSGRFVCVFGFKSFHTLTHCALPAQIEILTYCQLTSRQRLLYQALRNKISIEDLLQSSMGTAQQSHTTTSSLMNLVMQFRKVKELWLFIQTRQSRRWIIAIG